MPRSAPVTPRRIVDSGELMATLADVDIRSELSSRPSRAADHEALEKGMSALARQLADNPRDMLQELAELAVGLCRADSAGVSLMETHGGEEVFRWEALAGVFAPFRNGTMPRHASPCGTVIDRDSMQLMYLPDRFFPALRAEPRFVEALLVPFHAGQADRHRLGCHAQCRPQV